MPKKQKINVKKLILFIIWMTIFGLAIHYYFKWDIPLLDYPKKIQEVITSYGAWGPILYIIVYAIRPVIFFPATLLTAVSGALFGPVGGILYTIVGENLSANFAFILGRYFGRHFVAENERGWIKKIDKKVHDNGFMTVLMMRLLYFPFDLTNYGCGLTSVKHRDYALATFIGILPGLTTFVLLGASFTDPKNLIISAVVFILGLILSKFLGKRNKDLNDCKIYTK